VTSEKHAVTECYACYPIQISYAIQIKGVTSQPSLTCKLVTQMRATLKKSHLILQRVYLNYILPDYTKDPNKFGLRPN